MFGRYLNEEATAVKLDFLRSVYEQIGDYVSVYLDTDRAYENAAEAIGLRWHAVQEELAAAGASPASLTAVAEAVNAAGHAARGRAAFARDGAVAFAGTLDSPPRRQIARLAPLPHLMPLLAQHRPPVPHIRVSATREGGEIVAIGGSGEQWRDWIAGRAWPIHKTSVGGWSQDRYQRSVEEAWDENAKALAGEVAAVADQIHAEHVIVAGDVRARSLLISRLPAALAESAIVIGEEITADSPVMAEAADRALSQWADRRTRERFDDWQARLAHGLAVAGLAPVMAAFRDGQVSDLFVADDPTSTAAAWVGPPARTWPRAGTSCWNATCRTRCPTARTQPWCGPSSAPTPSCTSCPRTWWKPVTPPPAGASPGRGTE